MWESLTVISQICGWLYMISWSVSFYPQVYMNWRTKSVVGLSFDYLTYNMTGFVAYLAFTGTIYTDQHLRDLYNKDDPSASLVKLNDVAFAAHGVLLLLVQFCQVAMYERGGQIVSKSCRIITVLAWISIGITFILKAFTVITWLQLLVFLGTMKVGSAFIKYAPQAYLNFKRKSTVGWSVWQVLLDLAGGILSFAQMGIDGGNTGSWNLIVGNVPKLLLSIVSFTFDVIFVVQHYCIYTERREYKSIDSDEEISQPHTVQYK